MPRKGCEDDIKMDLEDERWMELAQGVSNVRLSF
jgi:hypothetical protein